MQPAETHLEVPERTADSFTRPSRPGRGWASRIGPALCPFCPKRYTRASGLLRHLRGGAHPTIPRDVLAEVEATLYRRAQTALNGNGGTSP